MLGDIFGSAISAVSNWLTGSSNRDSQERIAQQNIAMQKEFAQSGIQWKVQDAIKAGLHPLAALGAQTSSFSPVSVGSTDFGTMGQDLGRALKAAMSSEDRAEKEAAELDLETKRLNNDLIRQQIQSSKLATQSRRTGAVGPAMPTGKQVIDSTSVMKAPVVADDIKSKPDTYPAVQNLRLAAVPLKTMPWMTDAQDLEDRYGEAVSDWVAGPLNVLGDIGYSGYRFFKDRQGADWAGRFRRGFTQAGRR